MILILGAGESGIGAALLARSRACSVFVSDAGPIRESYRQELIDNDIDFEEGQHQIALDLQPELVVKSPGIPDSAEIIGHFKNRDIAVISEIEFAFRYCSGTVIGITGSNGKTTTTNLVWHLLHQGGLDAVKAGNVGFSFARAVAQKEWDWYVLELSSFQLDGIQDFRPHIAILLNITPDHLDRYAYQFDRYVASKFRITANQTAEDYLIIYGKDPAIQNYLMQHPVQAEVLDLRPEWQPDGKVLLDGNIFADLGSTTLKGAHNAINACCAITAAELAGAPAERIQSAMNDFVNDPHRLESVGSVRGVEFINDSKATNVDSVYWALGAIPQKLVWIAGGQDKGNDYTVLHPLVREKVKALVALGKDNRKLISAFEGLIPEIRDTHSVEDAVLEAYQIAEPGDVVLLSPACASFDLFRNYEDRGEQFKNEVHLLSLKSAMT
ncbi:MAG TPA: UDP-N-acetylmuramoyl-L-alanine--D-glutamate ligase [Saprospiraceae bacterium]|nr:UDP-N-acetylmuramoyl-L-alanine--D-glutamate ligase [Saprospiraceae bacterium]